MGATVSGAVFVPALVRVISMVTILISSVVKLNDAWIWGDG
jgi:hypothetical protein